jgi:hypothetical protein
MTDAVTHHADSVTHHAIPDAADKASNRRKQVREANVRYRARRRDGRVRLVVELNRKQLDASKSAAISIRSSGGIEPTSARLVPHNRADRT